MSKKKLSDYMSGYEDGLLSAYTLIKNEGIEALEKEIEFRKLTGIHAPLMKKQLNTACEAIKVRTVDTVSILSVAVLHDYFGFGKTRCERFMEGFNTGADYLMKDMATWDDYIKSIKEEIGLDMGIRYK